MPIPRSNRQKRVSDQRLAELQTLLALARIERKYLFVVGQILRGSIQNVSLYSVITFFLFKRPLHCFIKVKMFDLILICATRPNQIAIVEI